MECVIESTKSCISIMLSGIAAGEMLPPYVVCQAENMWSTWIDRGPNGCRYNRTKGGWFDIDIQRLVLHIGPSLIEETVGNQGCNREQFMLPHNFASMWRKQIKFLCLLTNLMHITQPLDVAYYGPMESVADNCGWMEKKTNQWPACPKINFPYF